MHSVKIKINSSPISSPVTSSNFTMVQIIASSTTVCRADAEIKGLRVAVLVV